jgi:hypothetical protein
MSAWYILGRCVMDASNESCGDSHAAFFVFLIVQSFS